MRSERFLENSLGFKIARKILKITQPYLAEKLGWKRGKNYIYKLEHGKKRITQKTALAMERLLRECGMYEEWLEAVNDPINRYKD